MDANKDRSIIEELERHVEAEKSRPQLVKITYLKKWTARFGEVEAKNESICSICTGALSEKAIVAITTCGHSPHMTCFDGLVKTNKILEFCPKEGCNQKLPVEIKASKKRYIYRQKRERREQKQLQKEVKVEPFRLIIHASKRKELLSSVACRTPPNEQLRLKLEHLRKLKYSDNDG